MTGRPACTGSFASCATPTPSEIRARYPDIPRRVSGYNLDSLLDEHHFDVAGLLVGSESTLVTVLRAELELVPVVKERTLVVLGFDSIMKAADAVPAILPHEPIALEGLDHRLIHDQRIKGLNPDALRDLPEGDGFLMVQFGGDTKDEADSAAHRMLDALARLRPRPTRQGSRRPGRGGRAVAGARGGPRRHRARARRAGHLGGLGGLGGAPRPARGLPARPGEAVRASSATPTIRRRASTATSARAACTPGSRSG